MFPFKYFILKYSFWIVFNSKPGITKKKVKQLHKTEIGNCCEIVSNATTLHAR